MVSIDPMEEGGPHVITATAGNMSIALNDVLFGDVWICSGQSNMQFTVPSVSMLLCIHSDCSQLNSTTYIHSHCLLGV